MKITELATEFTKELESFATNPIQIEPITEWNPKKAAAPERHMLLGKRADVSFESQVYMLEEQNQTFNRIESMLRIYMNSKQLQELPPPDAVKEQVWLFANTWLSLYYEMLTEPGILQSQFYKEEHDRFLGVLGSMLVTQPNRRISFIGALRKWFPASRILRSEEEPRNDIFVSSLPSLPYLPSLPSLSSLPYLPSLSSEISAKTPVTDASPSSVPVADVKRNRLVLKRSDGEERNKTRKNHRS